jgi:uncharacterized protein (TIGR02145 family)
MIFNLKRKSMKTIYFFIFMSIISLTGIGQNNTITLTFLAVDSVSQVNLSLDSIYIKNITAGCDTTISGATSSFILTFPSGIPGHEYYGTASFTILPPVPNPFTGTTIVRILSNQAGTFQLTLTDIQGKVISEYGNDLKTGLNKFEIKTSIHGLLLLNANNGHSVRSVSLISNGNGKGDNRIIYHGTDNNEIKSVVSVSGFSFHLGDQLFFKSIKIGYNDKILYDSPVKDTTYIFELTNTPTQPSVTTSLVTDITYTTATGGGEVTSDGGDTVTARGICWSSSPNPTIANNHTTDGTGTGTFVSNITGLTGCSLYYVRAYAINSVGIAYGNEVTFTTPWVCGCSININHLVSGGVAPVDKTVTYGTVTGIPGEPSKCWITSNLGANHKATKKNDATEPSAGWYWQFNRKQGYKHDGINRTPNTIWIDNIDENFDWEPANDPCALELGSGWRIPTYNEWNNVYTSGGWTNWDGPWSSGLKMHAAGYLYFSDGSLSLRGTTGYYWSSVQYYTYTGWLLFFNNAYSSMYQSGKPNGFSLRCLKD